MINIKIQSLGGKATAIKERLDAINKYYKNPQICQSCRKIIEVKQSDKVRDVKRKKFCNKSCAASFNNRKRPKKEKGNEIKSIKGGFFI